VSIYCRGWTGDLPSQFNIEVNILCNKAITNQGKDSQFIKDFKNAIKRNQPDLIIGFNKIPGVDIYYAADTCFKAKLQRERPWIYQFLPRYRHRVDEESRLFGQGVRTHILAIAQPAIDEYRYFYQTDPQRFTLLPPGISRDRINTAGERLFLLHKELGLAEDKLIILMVGSGFRTKGLDRAINAHAALPKEIRNDAHLVVAGEDNKKPFLLQAQRLGTEEKIHFLGGRKDIPQLLRSADVLIHPAYRENTGTVLLEAAISGLPVITTDVCGYAHFIANNKLGEVLASPYNQQQLDSALLTALTDTEKNNFWRKNGLVFSQQADIYSMPQKAVDVIEKIAQQDKQ
jgi:UDP-glucose:(heptosyl)LPS alpha-1,3-glucosyltransferase